MLSKSSSKAQLAQRTIEIFQLIDEVGRPISVTDIAHRFSRPQSSTSDLLKKLVELGLLYKDKVTRTYAPTPRIAALGMARQPIPIADGSLFREMDLLAREAECAIGLFGIVGVHTQVFRWSSSNKFENFTGVNGDKLPLSSSAAGVLLLSSLDGATARSILWRLKAEAEPARRYAFAQIAELVSFLRRRDFVTGEAGFAQSMQMTAVLMPVDLLSQPTVLGVVYRGDQDESRWLPLLRGLIKRVRQTAS